MKNILVGKWLAPAGLCAVALSMAVAFPAQAQTSAGGGGLQYKIVEGQVYAYEPGNPAGLYRMPNLTPEQVGLGGEVEAQERAAALRSQSEQATYGQAANPYANNAALYGNPNAFVYGNQSGYGYPGVTPMAPTRPAASNNALPTLTFREPFFSPHYLPRLANPIGGLPRYPGKNYYPGYAAPAPW